MQGFVCVQSFVASSTKKQLTRTCIIKHVYQGFIKHKDSDLFQNY